MPEVQHLCLRLLTRSENYSSNIWRSFLFDFMELRKGNDRKSEITWDFDHGIVRHQLLFRFPQLRVVVVILVAVQAHCSSCEPQAYDWLVEVVGSREELKQTLWSWKSRSVGKPYSARNCKLLPLSLRY